MRPVGFSTGALAHGDARRALSMLEGQATSAVEISALRLGELAPIMELLGTLDLSPYTYVSFHAPSRFDRREEAGVVEAISRVIAPRRYPIVLHPDTIHDFGPWRELGDLVSIENMDKRKPVGRTVAELSRVFAELPQATFCFDIGHARQVDRTMNEAYFLLEAFGPRLTQLHVSEVSTDSRHDPVSRAAAAAFQKVAAWIPEGVPLILESPAKAQEIAAQLEDARAALTASPDGGLEHR